MASTFTNADGLTRRYGGDGIPSVGNARATCVYGAVGQVVVDFTYDNLPGYDRDAGGGETPDSFSGLQAYVPAGSYISSALLVVTEEWDSDGDDCTLTIGLHEKDGTVIDADGIDDAIAEAAMAANTAVACDGDLVGGTATVGADDAYIRATTANSPTAGAARLVVTYVMV